ncbi:MAG: SRPBCC domain-containing protein [Actinomycetota bacterium]|nr:SRPBCC domain-containing protein [Actinomycetota bacterium]
MTDYALNHQHTFKAGPERLWQAWTTEAGLADWWWNGWPTTTYTVDLRVGGSYRITAEPQGIGVHGEYLEIVPLQRLVFSWIWVYDGVDGDLTEHVEVQFVPVDGGTRVDLLHTGQWTGREPADNYLLGWQHVFGSLEQLLAEPQGS